MAVANDGIVSDINYEGRVRSYRIYYNYDVLRLDSFTD
jgi:hypothetical protein